MSSPGTRDRTGERRALLRFIPVPRILAVAALLVAPGLAWFGSASWGILDPALVAWLAPGLSILTATAMAVALRRNAGLWGLSAIFGAAACSMLVDARSVLDAARVFEDHTNTEEIVDLTRAAMPPSPPAYVAVRGYLRDAWVLDEYAVAPDELPDQSRPARAVLVPMVGTTDEVVTLRGAIVVARVPPGQFETTSAVTLRGATSAVSEPVVRTLVQITGVPADANVTAVMVDTLAVPDPDRAWIRATVAGLVLLIALGCAWTASGPRAA